MGFCAALALLVLGQAVAPAPGFTPGAGEVTLRADVLRYRTDTDQVVADGHVRLEGQGVTVLSDHLTYDARARRAVADHARILRGQTVGVADRVVVELDTSSVALENGLFLQKKGTSLAQLLGAPDAEALVATGQNQLALRGARIQRVSEDELAVDHLSFTPCDCDPAHPSWRIDARRAEVKVGDSVFLSWPVIYVHGVPVFAFPALDLPLKDRRSGLLIPVPASSSNNGFSLEQPVFLTLGDSYDLTFTPGYFFGTDSPNKGIQGPRLETDFRYAPTAGLRGEFALALLEDLKAPRLPETSDPKKLLDGRRGLRWSLGGTHVQELGNGLEDRVDLSLVSDGYLSTDLSTDLLVKENKYLTSDAALVQRRDDRYLGVALGYRQDLRHGFDLFETRRTENGLLAPHTLQQLPDALAAWPLRPLAFGWLGALNLRFTRLAPLFSRFGDEGEDGAYLLLDDAAAARGVGDRTYQPGERVARDRLDLSPRLSRTFEIGRFVSLTPTFALRQDLYASELGDAGTQNRGHAWVDLEAQSRIARTFGGPGGWTHAIEPSVQFRYAPHGWGTPLGPAVGPLTGGLRPYDAIDLAMPDEGITQLVAQVSQRLLRREGLATRELLRLDLGEELDLRADHPPRDAFARLGTDLLGLHLAGLVRYDVRGRRLAQLSGSASVDLWGRASLYGIYNNLLLGGSAAERRGLDTLIGTPYPEGELGRAQFLTAGGSVRLGGGVGLRYDAIVQPTQPTLAQTLAQQVLGISFAPACDCWTLELNVRATRNKEGDPLGDFRVGGSLTIAHFGKIGTGG